MHRSGRSAQGHRWVAGRTLFAGAAVAAGSVVAPVASIAASPPALVRISGNVAALPAGAVVLGPADARQVVTVDVTLRPRDVAALGSFASAVSSPGSPSHGHYLSTAAFRQAFAPAPSTLAAVRAWLAASGLSVGATSANGMLVPVTGSVGRLEQVFSVPLVQTRLPGGRVSRAATADPELPADLAPAVQGVVGLSTVAQASPHLVRGPSPVVTPPGGLRAAAVDVPHAGPSACGAASQAAGIFHGWTADQLASAYGLSSLYDAGRVGAGQQVGIFELAPYVPGDIAAYQSCFGTSASVTDVPVDGGATSGAIDEADLDIEVVAGLAPSASISVFSGPNNGGTGPIDTYTAMVDDPSVRVLSTSWGVCESSMSANDRAAEAALFQQATAQGQTVVAASGDSGSSDCYDPMSGTGNHGLAVDDPADQPNVTGVGGTSLSNFGPDAPVETTWNNGANGGGSGGGNSVEFPAPGWQQIPAAQNPDTAFNCGPSMNAQCREVPDVAASSDPNHGDIVYIGGSWIPVGGTSAAAPLWAALTADIGQGCATPAGFLNTKLYPAGAGGSPPFHDVTTGNNNLFGNPQFPATAGYDLATGWGSPQAPSLLGVLTGAAAGCPSVTSLNPNAGRAFGGTTVVIGGSGFGSGQPVVQFGSATANVISHTPTSVTVTTPDVVTGATVPVTVTSFGLGGGTSADVPAAAYTFVSPHVTSVVPIKGPIAGGSRVTVRGTDFAGATSVRFGSAESPSFQVMSPTSLVAQAPAGPAGGATVDVVVTNPDGQSPAVAADHYHYALPGYWLVASDGGIFSYGAAAFYGSTGNLVLNKPVVGMAATPDDGGYWLVASDGGIFSYGDANFYGSTGNISLNKPVVGMAATPDGGGYWLVASDGGIFSYGDAGFYGSTGSLALNAPVVGMTPSLSGVGYWLVASDGGIFSYGDAAFFGSTGGTRLNAPVVGMADSVTARRSWPSSSFVRLGRRGAPSKLTDHVRRRRRRARGQWHRRRGGRRSAVGPRRLAAPGGPSGGRRRRAGPSSRAPGGRRPPRRGPGCHRDGAGGCRARLDGVGPRHRRLGFAAGLPGLCQPRGQGAGRAGGGGHRPAPARPGRPASGQRQGEPLSERCRSAHSGW
jgi:pro-kumamolisin-like protein/IPT/TIG domain-containing protein